MFLKTMESCSPPYSLAAHLWRSYEGFCNAGVHAGFRDYVTRQINAILWVSLIAITYLLFRKVTKLFGLWSKAKLIPGLPCPSFYGHSKLLSGANFTDILSKPHQKYGPVVKLWLGPTQLLVSIKDPELIKEMLLKAEDKLPLTGRAFHLAFGRSSLFMSSFDEVQKRRHLLASELNGKLLELENGTPKKIVDCVMKRIHDIGSKGSLDCKTVSQHLASTFLGATLFGDAFLAWPEAIIYEELLMMIAKDACFWASYGVIPFWKKEFWRYQNLCAKLKSLTKDIIQQCQQNDKLHNQIDQSPHDKIRKTAEESCGKTVSMMFHGYLTTAGLVGNILARLAQHPELQDKIHNEVVMVRRASQNQEQQSVGKMPFLLATVYESARLLPAGPLLQRCSLKHDVNLKTGLTIPAGAILVVPVRLVQMDDSSWGSDASQFNPYRFLSKTEKNSNLDDVTSFKDAPVDLGQDSYVLNDPNENDAFLPFGSGARACLGQKFAILGLTAMFASLIEQYEIRLQPGHENDPKPMMNNCVLQLLPSPKITFVKRES
ncbi:11-oxo-beta-amyrin 30-oxidase [Bertholletia excelsa]